MQIQKYLNGELDARAMHKLEMEALNDPFLMDALEGYENMGTSQQLNLGDLTARLQQRTGENKGRVIPWTVWPIAASVLIALSLGGLYLNKTSKPELQSNNVAENRNSTPPLAAAADTIKTADTVKKANTNQPGTVQAPSIAVTKKSRRIKQSADALYQQEISAADNKTASNEVAPPVGSTTLAEPAAPPPVAKDKVVLKEEGNLSERIVAGYTAPIAKKDTVSSDVIALRANTTVAKSKTPLQFKLPGKVDGVTSSPVTVFGGSKAAAQSLYIAGTIISRDDGSPLIGAAIRIKGTNRSTVTDVNGKFALSSPGDKATLDVVYIGYEPRQISATRGDSVKVALKPDSHALSEVVVSSPKRDDDNSEVSVTAAHPQLGWGSLKKYLQTNAVLPDGTAGTVTVTFTVFPSGITDEFNIKKGLNEAADQKAIELIKNGPSWVGSTNNKPEVVTVKVKFQK
ncbi:carboxypeptidase-like regulatory domain-containing protein [Mucilaginibacter sp. cycad4]|uniref:carboxypeptidase-like regulatory domain-containing protein n=1 Tax=Mucilaginibacter sp. cycad4 TaxID=3342096 RepID=UPI002AAC49FD|nr:carboxypeptidase-like regulatory domain-containing protein [Mucilaginibacter gossypii]WPU98999.1 carboxypeptidase-like regulatory domain-containing protein [Mucilaginibacter gossypii]